jgi:hypothetical protein
MKKILLGSLLAVLVVSNFSFTNLNGNLETSSRTEKAFKKYTVVVSEVYPFGSCNITVSIMISFYWNGPGTPITNVTVESAPVVTLNCGGEPLEARPSVVSSSFSGQTGHITELTFTSTGNETIDDALSDPTFMQLIYDEINEQVDSQD